LKLFLLLSILIFSCDKNSSVSGNNCTADVDLDNICDNVDDCIDINNDSICDDKVNYPLTWDTNLDGLLDDLNNYEFNGSITSMVVLDDVNIVNGGDLLAAFIGDDQRGIAITTQVPEGLEPHAGSYQFLMLIYSNTASGEVVNFQYYNLSADEEVDITNTITFTPNMTLGNLVDPIILNISIPE